MRHRYHITVEFDYSSQGRIERIVREMGLSSDLHLSSVPGWPSYFVKTLESEHARDQLLRRLMEEGIPWREHVERVVAIADIRKAPLSVLSVDKPIVNASLTYAEQWESLAGCRTCGTGSRQVAPARLVREKLPNNILLFQTIERDLFLAPSLVETLLTMNLSGYRLVQAVSSNDALLDWWQIIPTNVLPQLARKCVEELRSIDVPGCQVCGRDGHFYEIGIHFLRYEREDIANCADWNYTFECFGLSGIVEPYDRSHFARPLMLVSARVFEAFEMLAPSNAVFDPIEIV